MAQIIVRNLDDAIVERLKARAHDNDRSLEAGRRRFGISWRNRPRWKMPRLAKLP
ncbi:MAG: FitA-like ribbon-helix-helix domain-containing protein [Methanothrix sp.]